jgi:adenine deaminase
MIKTNIKHLKANILDLEKCEIYPALLTIENSYFKEVNPITTNLKNLDLDFKGIIVPGFIDAHIHIESTMLTPSSFAYTVVPHGTTSVIADPHEIANVMGIEGINFMIADGNKVPFDFFYTAPSCVPATPFENTGGEIDLIAIEDLMQKDEIVGLGELMNYVGLIANDSTVLSKLKIAKSFKKPIDGHAPQLSGEDLKKYISEGVSTDHECVSFNEAIEKKMLGMKIMVREGSSAKNMEALFNLKDRINFWSNQNSFGSISVKEFEEIMKNPIFDFLVSDDKDSSDLIKGHINILIKKAIKLGIDPIEAIKMVTINPAKHYNLNSGLIAKDKIANFILIDNLNDLNIKKTFVHGELVAEDGKTLFKFEKSPILNNFNLSKKTKDDFDMKLNNIINNNTNNNTNINTNINNNDHVNNSNKNTNRNNIINNNSNNSNNININKNNQNIDNINNFRIKDGKIKVKVIEVINRELITNNLSHVLELKNGTVQADMSNDILKIAVVNRYGNGNIANAFVKGFNLKNGALASSISHDSHNIVVVGTNSEYMAKAVNLISKHKGGLSAVSKNIEKVLKLPVAGLMSNEKADQIAIAIKELHEIAKSLGSTLDSPFMTLSFMTLLVIPHLKLSDKGLFDVDKFKL